jgi:hypothetical protein
MQATSVGDAAADEHSPRLSRGVRVGPYEMTGFLGAGGMWMDGFTSRCGGTRIASFRLEQHHATTAA